MTTAAVCTSLSGTDNLALQDWVVRDVGPGDVRLDVRAASVNFPDVLMVRGLYQAKLEPPFVAGSACAGVITDMGPGVRDLAVGDRVIAVTGAAFATEAVAKPPAQQVHRIPDDMPFDQAAAFDITYGTGIHGLVGRGGLVAGESVLVLGAAGGCGSAAVQIAKAVGAFVVGVAGGDEKCALVRKLGADVVLDHRVVESLSGAVKEATGGRGVDVVFDTVGGADVREPLRCLAWNGRYLVIGFAAGEIPVLKLNQTILKSISVVGVAYGMSAIADPAGNAHDFRQLFDWYEQGLVTPAIGHRFPLHDAAEAMRVVHEREAIGKVVIEMPA
ncbi:MAG: NADPH:quinone reductase [Actinomycetota bacterium]|nr:NADPH:quinone reductase [Actinomycetota bacterium]